MKISVCGKGGSGKSTVVALLARQAEAQGQKVLVVDSDESNTGLFRMLGFKQPPPPLMELVGGRKEMMAKMRTPGILAADRITVGDIPSPYLLSRNGIQLVSIGKILQSLEGCACPMGVLSREFLAKLSLESNEIAIVDMEAGVEHFGRGVDNSIDTLLLVVGPSMESIAVAEKIQQMAAGMQKNLFAVLNRIGSETIASRLKHQLEQKAITVIGVIPDDPVVFEAGLDGRAVETGSAFDAADRIFTHLAIPK